MSEVATFDALLDTNLENIEDLADFELFPKGVYQLMGGNVKIIEADGDKDSGVQLTMSNVAAIELENPDEEPPKEGSLLSQRFTGEFGVKMMKKVFGDVMAKIGATTPREFLDQFEGLEFAAQISHRRDKNDKDKVYNDIKLAVIQ